MKKTRLISLGRKAVFCCMMFSFFMINSSHAQNSTAQKYIQQHSKLAMKLMQQSGVPASVILGVAMVESSLGRSKSSKVLHNHFGIIGKNQKKEEMGYKSQYRQFESAEASYKNFVHIVTSKSFYDNLKGSLDFTKWLRGLNRAGYCATDQHVWTRDITYFIQKYSLNKYDKIANWQQYEVNLLEMLNR